MIHLFFILYRHLSFLNTISKAILSGSHSFLFREGRKFSIVQRLFESHYYSFEYAAYCCFLGLLVQIEADFYQNLHVLLFYSLLLVVLNLLGAS